MVIIHGTMNGASFGVATEARESLFAEREESPNSRRAACSVTRSHRKMKESATETRPPRTDFVRGKGETVW